MDLSVIIPAHNEEKRITKHLTEVGETFSDPKGPKTEIIVVINNTTDHTKDVVEKLQDKFPNISYIDIPYYTGKGGAVSAGIEKAKGTFIGFVDADGSSPASEVLRLYNWLKDHPDTDGVIASRYMEGSELPEGIPFNRRVQSRIFNIMTKTLFGLSYKDTQCGLKVFTKPAAKSFYSLIESVGWTFDINVLLINKYLNQTIVEIPSIWTHTDDSKLDLGKAFLEIPQELFMVKKLEMRFKWNSFADRTFKKKKTRPEPSVLWISKTADLKKEVTGVAKQLSINATLKFFTPRARNKSGNESIDNIEFIRRGGRFTSPIWLCIYYTLFFRASFDAVLIPMPKNIWEKIWYRVASFLISSDILMSVDGNTIFNKGFKYTLKAKSVLGIAESNSPRTILSKKFYPWSRGLSVGTDIR